MLCEDVQSCQAAHCKVELFLESCWVQGISRLCGCDMIGLCNAHEKVTRAQEDPPFAGRGVM